MSNTDRTKLDFELVAATEVYNYIMERSEHIEGINAEVFATRAVVAGFGPLIAKLVKGGSIPKVDITEVVNSQIRKGTRRP